MWRFACRCRDARCAERQAEALLRDGGIRDPNRHRRIIRVKTGVNLPKTPGAVRAVHLPNAALTVSAWRFSVIAYLVMGPPTLLAAFFLSGEKTYSHLILGANTGLLFLIVLKEILKCRRWSLRVSHLLFLSFFLVLALSTAFAAGGSPDSAFRQAKGLFGCFAWSGVFLLVNRFV